MLDTLTDTFTDPDEVPAWLIPVLAQQVVGIPFDAPDLDDTHFAYRVEMLPPLFPGTAPTVHDGMLRDELGYPVRLGSQSTAEDRMGVVAIVRDVNGGAVANLDANQDRNKPHITSIFSFFKSDDLEELHEVNDLVQGMYDHTMDLTGNKLDAAHTMVCTAFDLGKRLGVVNVERSDSLFTEVYGITDSIPDPFPIVPAREALKHISERTDLVVEAAPIQVIVQSEETPTFDMSWLDMEL